MAGTKHLKVTQVKSSYGQLRHIAASVRGLGLRRRHHTVSVADTPHPATMAGLEAVDGMSWRKSLSECADEHA